MSIAKYRALALCLIVVLLVTACAQAPAPAPTQVPPKPAAAAPTTAPAPAATVPAAPQPTQVPAAAPTAPKALIPVKIGLVLAGSVVPAIVARDSGFFANEGLQVEIVEFPSGGAATQALIGRQVPIAGFSLSSTLDFYLRGQFLKNIVLLQNRPITQIVTRKELNIKPGDWNALKGKKIGVSGPGGATDILLRVLLLNMGWDPEKDVQIINTGGVATQQAALASGQVDAQSTFEPGYSQWTLPGPNNIANDFLDMRADNAPDPLPRLPQSSLAVSADYVTANPAIVKGVARAIGCAAKAIQANPSLAGKAYAVAFPGLNQAVYDNIVKLEAKVIHAEITPEQIKTTSDVYKKLGQLKSDVTYEQVVETSLAPEWACK